MVNPSIHELDLLKRIKNKERKAVLQLYQDYFDRIAQFIVSNSGSREDARDIFQETLIVLFRKTQDPDFELRASLYTFIYAISRNIWFGQLKKKKIKEVTINEEITSIGASDQIEAALIEHQLYELYVSKLKLLGEACQKVLKLMAQGVSVKEIMRQMNFSSELYTRKRKFKCKEQIIKLIHKDALFKALNS